MTTKCSNCNATIIAGHKFCSYCRTPVPTVQETPIQVGEIQPQTLVQPPTATNSTGSELVLIDGGRRKITVIKTVREITGWGLREGKDAVDNTPSVLKRNLSHDEAIKWKTLLERDGAIVEIR